MTEKTIVEAQAPTPSIIAIRDTATTALLHMLRKAACSHDTSSAKEWSEAALRMYKIVRDE